MHKGSKEYFCKHCLKAYSRRFNFVSHLRIHAGEKPYTCNECFEKFTYNATFKIHLQKHKGKNTNISNANWIGSELNNENDGKISDISNGNRIAMELNNENESNLADSIVSKTDDSIDNMYLSYVKNVDSKPYKIEMKDGSKHIANPIEIELNNENYTNITNNILSKTDNSKDHFEIEINNENDTNITNNILSKTDNLKDHFEIEINNENDTNITNNILSKTDNSKDHFEIEINNENDTNITNNILSKTDDSNDPFGFSDEKDIDPKPYKIEMKDGIKYAGPYGIVFIPNKYIYTEDDHVKQDHKRIEIELNDKNDTNITNNILSETDHSNDRFGLSNEKNIDTKQYKIEMKDGIKYAGPYGIVFIPNRYIYTEDDHVIEDHKRIEIELNDKNDPNITNNILSETDISSDRFGLSNEKNIDTKQYKIEMKDGIKYAGPYGTVFIPNKYIYTEDVHDKEDPNAGKEEVNGLKEYVKKEEETTLNNANDLLVFKKVCSWCSRTFKNKYTLKVHLKIHTKGKKYSCKICHKNFSRKDHLNSHLIVHTGGDKKFSCNECPKRCSRKSDLNTHLKIHSGEKAYKCTNCSKYFTQISTLKVHERIHSGEKPFACNQCRTSFTQKIGLVRHLKTHTNGKQFFCTHCSKYFLQNERLISHTRIHTGEKPYKCGECFKGFTRHKGLKTHLIKHTNVKLPACTECNKSYVDKWILKRHMEIHVIKEKTSKMETRRGKSKSQ